MNTISNLPIKIRTLFWIILTMILALSACTSQVVVIPSPPPELPTPTVEVPQATETLPQITPVATRPAYAPGELVDYIAQTGDTLPALAARFNTTIDQILTANPAIPANATTMPPGMPMQIPIYYHSFWGSPYQIIPDSAFVNGPSAPDLLEDPPPITQTGWFFNYSTYAANDNRTGMGLVQYVAENFSLNPLLLLALLEYQTGALSDPVRPANLEQYPLGFEQRGREGLYLQLVLAANALNNEYYNWRMGNTLEFDLADGRVVRIDPWQNSATASLQGYFAGLESVQGYEFAVSPIGLAQTYANLFGDPWSQAVDHIPGSLVQPAFSLPFEANQTWAYTGGPHTGWGTGAPFAAIDFAPPTDVVGCNISTKWATAVADGVIVRTDVGMVMLDLDGDGDERTGWVMLYLHIATEGRVTVGTVLQKGDHIGHPSCEGGTSTGTHIHIARKYNGEWIVADSPIPFELGGWVTKNGDSVYAGELIKFTQTVIACECGDKDSQLRNEEIMPTPTPVP